MEYLEKFLKISEILWGNLGYFIFPDVNILPYFYNNTSV